MEDYRVGPIVPENRTFSRRSMEECSGNSDNGDYACNNDYSPTGSEDYR